MSGFVADPGTNFGSGAAKEIAARLDRLGKQLGKTIHGISGIRSPAHSVEVGGFANDPHTKAEAVDFGVDSSLRASAAQLTDAQLASVGLYRPFPGAAEINHVQVKPGTEGKSFLDSVGGVLGAPGKWLANNDPLSVGVDTAKGPVGDAAGNVATDVADKLVSMATDAIGKDLVRWALYAALVIGGTALVLIGGSRAFGAGPTTS